METNLVMVMKIKTIVRLVNKKIKIGITFNLSRLIVRLKAPYASNQKRSSDTLK